MLAARVGAFAQLHQRNPLSLAGRVALNLSKGPLTLSSRPASGVLTRKGQVLLLETNVDVPLC